LYDYQQPIILGTRHSLLGFDFPDGGSTWIVSHAALQLWGPAIDKCIPEVIGEKKGREMLGSVTDPNRAPVEKYWSACKDIENPGLWCSEDVFLYYCMKRAGVRFVYFEGSSTHVAVDPSTVSSQKFNRSGKD
jgi:hypothetical protein